MERYDVIVVGGGPAGLSAALVLGRCLRRVVVCDAGKPRNAASRGLHGYLSRDGIVPSDLLAIGREEIARYGVELRQTEVVDAECHQHGVRARLTDGTVLEGRRLLLATGMIDELPAIDGVRELYGRSVHHCPYCDGWEHRGKHLIALGDPKDAAGLALSLLTWSKLITVCTNGAPPPGAHYRRRLARQGIAIRTEPIARLEGEDGALKRLVFSDGDAMECDAIFFNTGQVQRSPLAQRLGCGVDEKGHVRSDARGRTRVQHVFLAGDANGDVQFAIVAAAEGASAAVTINTELQKEDLASADRAVPASERGFGAP